MTTESRQRRFISARCGGKTYNPTFRMCCGGTIKSGREYDPRVAGLKLTILISGSAVVVLYKTGRESDPRVAGLKLTILISGSAVVALYNLGRE